VEQVGRGGSILIINGMNLSVQEERTQKLLNAKERPPKGSTLVHTAVFENHAHTRVAGRTEVSVTTVRQKFDPFLCDRVEL